MTVLYIIPGRFCFTGSNKSLTLQSVGLVVENMIILLIAVPGRLAIAGHLRLFERHDVYHLS